VTNTYSSVIDNGRGLASASDESAHDRASFTASDKLIKWRWGPGSAECEGKRLAGASDRFCRLMRGFRPAQIAGRPEQTESIQNVCCKHIIVGVNGLDTEQPAAW
jgi:hypothetical protein